MNASGRAALVTDAATWSWRDVGEAVAAAMTTLERRGVARGVRASLVATASRDVVVTLLALFELRAVVVPIHPRLTAFERATLVRAGRVDVEIDEELLGACASAPAIDAWPEPSAGEPDDPLAIVFTSGTSGAPKGAVLPRRAFVESARASAANLGDVEGDAWLACMPLAHVGGLSLVTRA
ncbi:MAG TPA: AMP-binding protein, partial [Byssovorax sp.]